MRGEPAAVRIYRSLLRFYPKRFREEFGADMALLFREQCSDEPTARVVARTVLDLALTAPAQHLEVHVRRNATPLLSWIYLAIAAAGVALAVIGGTNGATLIIGIVIAFAAGTLGVSAHRRAAPASTSDASASWWKLLLAGPLLIGVVIVAAGFGVEAWYLGMITVFVAFALMAMGVVLGVARLFGRRGHLAT